MFCDNYRWGWQYCLLLRCLTCPLFLLFLPLPPSLTLLDYAKLLSATAKIFQFCLRLIFAGKLQLKWYNHFQEKMMHMYLSLKFYNCHFSKHEVLQNIFAEQHSEFWTFLLEWCLWFLPRLEKFWMVSFHIFRRTPQRFKDVNSRDNAFPVNVSVSSWRHFPAAEVCVFVDCWPKSGNDFVFVLLMILYIGLKKKPKPTEENTEGKGGR